MKKFITLAICALFCAMSFTSCSSMKTDFLSNAGSFVSPKNVTLIGVTAAIGKKPQLCQEFAKVSVALRKVTADQMLTMDDLKNLVLESIADSSIKNKNLVIAALACAFDYYSNSITFDEEKNAKYVSIINGIADGIDEALELNTLTEGEVPASTK